MDALGTKTGALTFTLGLADVEVDGADVNTVLSNKTHAELQHNGVYECVLTLYSLAQRLHPGGQYGSDKYGGGESSPWT